MSAGVRLFVLWLGATVVAVTVAIQAVGFASTQVVGPVPATVGLGGTPNTTPASINSSTDADDAAAASSDGPSGASDAAAPPVTDPVAITTQAPGTSTNPATGITRSVSSVGGTATFRFVDGAVALLTASPNGGFAVEVDAKDDDVEVRFVSDVHESRVRARAGREDAVEVSERARDQGGSDEPSPDPPADDTAEPDDGDESTEDESDDDEPDGGESDDDGDQG